MKMLKSKLLIFILMLRKFCIHLISLILIVWIHFKIYYPTVIPAFGDSCDQAFRTAWNRCNEHYNNKCSYLSYEFKPICTPNLESADHRYKGPLRRN